MDTGTDSDFTLHHRADILAIVDRMLRERALTTVEFDDGHAVISSVLEVRRDSHVMVFDVAREPDQNRRLFASQSLHFVTELDHVHIAFETHAASLVSLADGPAAIVELPERIVRLQRREWFRAALPLEPPIRCTVVGSHADLMPGQAIDLSRGGAALLVGDAAAKHARPGAHHELILSLPEVGRLELDATLRSITQAPSSDDSLPKVRMGFRFDALPAKTANQIQRYVQQVEVTKLRVLKRRD